MLTDLIAAKTDEANAILSTQGHASIWPTLDAHTVDQVKLVTLAFLLKGQPASTDRVARYVESFESLASGGDDGPWIDLLPRELTQALAHLSVEQLPSIAKAWASTEEALLDRWNAADVAVFLKDLSAFAASALEHDREVMLWVCL